MPIYEYVCPSCDTKFEKMRPMSQADAKAECPKCRAASPRVLSKFACCSTDSSGVTSSIAGSGPS